MSFRKAQIERQFAVGTINGWGFGSGGLDGADAAGQFGGGSSSGDNTGGGPSSSDDRRGRTSRDGVSSGQGGIGREGGGSAAGRARDSLSGRRSREGYQASSVADRRGLTDRGMTAESTAEAAKDALADVALAKKHGIDPDVEGYDAAFRGSMSRQAGVNAQDSALGTASSIGLGLLGGVIGGPFGAMAASSVAKSAVGANAQANARESLGLDKNSNAASDFGGQVLSNMVTSAIAPASLVSNPLASVAMDRLGNPVKDHVDASFVAGTPGISSPSTPAGSFGVANQNGLLAQVQQQSPLVTATAYQAPDFNLNLRWPTA